MISVTVIVIRNEIGDSFNIPEDFFLLKTKRICFKRKNNFIGP